MLEYFVILYAGGAFALTAFSLVAVGAGCMRHISLENEAALLRTVAMLIVSFLIYKFYLNQTTQAALSTQVMMFVLSFTLSRLQFEYVKSRARK